MREECVKNAWNMSLPEELSPSNDEHPATTSSEVKGAEPAGLIKLNIQELKESIAECYYSFFKAKNIPISRKLALLKSNDCATEHRPLGMARYLASHAKPGVRNPARTLSRVRSSASDTNPRRRVELDKRGVAGEAEQPDQLVYGGTWVCGDIPTKIGNMVSEMKKSITKSSRSLTFIDEELRSLHSDPTLRSYAVLFNKPVYSTEAVELKKKLARVYQELYTEYQFNEEKVSLLRQKLDATNQQIRLELLHGDVRNAE